MMVRKMFRFGIAVAALATAFSAQAAQHEEAGAAPGMGKGMGMMGMHGMMMGDGDAKVSKEEFLKHAEERFARMDANQDGAIDADDREKMRARMKDCMDMMHGSGMGGMGMMGGGMGMMGDKAGAMGKPTDEHSAHHPAP